MRHSGSPKNVIRGVAGSLSAQTRQLLGTESATSASGILLGAGDQTAWGDVLALGIDALGDWRTLVWHASTGGSRSRAIKDRLRALGQYPGLIEHEIYSQTTIVTPSRIIYSDVGLVASNARQQLTLLLSRPMAPVDVALGFFRNPGTNVIEQWTNAALGLMWLWVNRVTVGQQPIASTEASRIVKYFQDETISLGGVCLLLIATEDVGPLLWIAGSREHIREVKLAIESSCTLNWSLGVDDLSRLWRVGFV
jgi:hypothetical protein